jgi:hypothetical protein
LFPPPGEPVPSPLPFLPPPFEAPAWDTDTVLPATVTLPLRAPPFVAGTVTVAVPDPDPDPLTDTHDVPLDAVHAHPAPAVTVTEAEPPEAVKLSEVGDTA